MIAGSGLFDRLTRIPARHASPDDIALYHTRDHIERVRALCDEGGGEASVEVGDATPVVPASYAAATLAVGGGMAAVDAVLDGDVANAYALLRPPGHHAMAAAAMGFCIFNNVVIAARHAQRRHGLRRVMIVDWDVHDGNGTQAAFYDDPDVLFVSLHQEDWYPLGWGKVGDVGNGDAAGRTVNIPLPPGTATRATSKPSSALSGRSPGSSAPSSSDLGRAGPQYDGPARPYDGDDGWLPRPAGVMREIAGEICNGRLVGLQEGGYSADYVPFCTLAIVEAFLGRRSIVRDPIQRRLGTRPRQREYRAHQSAAIDAVVAVQRQFWRL